MIIISIILFGFSDGFCVGGIFVLASEDCMSSQDKENAGWIMVFASTIGMMLGTFLSLPFFLVRDN